MLGIPVKKGYTVFAFALLLLMPAYAANAQSSEKIIILENFGVHDKGELLFLFGNVVQVVPDSFLILQVINPDGEICQIQQLSPLSNGQFLTEQIPLKGRICGVVGDYEVKLFYGDYSTSTKFTVGTTTFQEPTGSQYLERAIDLVNEKIESVAQKTSASMVFYTERLTGATTSPSDNTIEDLEKIYTDLWIDFLIDDELFELDANFRPAVTSSLDSTAELIESDKLSFDIARDIDRQTFAAVFYYEIGDKKTAIEKLNDVFVSIKNVDPIKIERKKALTYAELEEAVQNLMTKTGFILSKQVKEELAFIFARGTAPLYTEELNDMLDMLTEARYLDVISRKDNPLYRIIQTDWESVKPSLSQKESIEEFLESKERVDKLHQAALLLRDLDNVDRFIDRNSDENSELATILMPDWEDLAQDLELASSVDDILDAEQEIQDMKNVIDISSRISKAVDVSKSTNVDSSIVDGWEDLLERVRNADSIPEILTIVSEFDTSINELREKRNPLSILKFEYETMKAKAELQADHQNLFKINNALKILDTAQKMESGHPSVSRIDRIEVLLTWVSESAPQIKEDLNSYTKDAYKVRAGDILQRAKSIENLIDLSLRNNRFLPGYTDFTNSMEVKLENIRSLVLNNDLEQADSQVRELFSEWQTVSSAYADDPHGSSSGYSLDELKRIEFRKHMETLNSAVNNFYNSDFAPYSDEYSTLTADAYELIDYGNFVDAESKIAEIGTFLENHLALNHDRIIYDIAYDQEQDIWVLSGFLDKTIDWRQNLYLTIYDKDANIHSSLKFTDTREGEFYTRWHAPAEPGLYVVMLEWENAKASQLVYIPEEVDYVYSESDLSIVDLAREFEELESFIEAFGGENYQEKSDRLASIMNDIEQALNDRNTEQAKRKIVELQNAIERYLPERSRYAVIEVQYNNDQLLVSGAVQKTLSFSEDLFVDIFDQKGNLIDEIALKDSSSGHFSEVISTPFSPGTYVAQLNYHDFLVTDFFVVRG